MDLIQWIFGTIAVVGGGAATLLLGTVQSLRKDREDYVARDDRKTREIADLNTKVAQLSADVATATNERDILGKQLRGDDALATMGAKLDDVAHKIVTLTGALGHHNVNASEHWNAEEVKLDRLVVILTEVRDEVRRQKGTTS